jgi:predicted RNase H-like HicB family nuclease
MKFRVKLWQDEHGVWIVECPSIPGCVSQGATKHEALASIHDAIQACLQVRAESGIRRSIEERLAARFGAFIVIEAPPHRDFAPAIAARIAIALSVIGLLSFCIYISFQNKEVRHFIGPLGFNLSALSCGIGWWGASKFRLRICVAGALVGTAALVAWLWPMILRR